MHCTWWFLPWFYRICSHLHLIISLHFYLWNLNFIRVPLKGNMSTAKQNRIPSWAGHLSRARANEGLRSQLGASMTFITLVSFWISFSQTPRTLVAFLWRLDLPMSCRLGVPKASCAHAAYPAHCLGAIFRLRAEVAMFETAWLVQVT